MRWEPELLKYTNKVERLAEVYGVPYDHNGHLEAFAQSLVHRELRDHFAGLAMQSLLTKASITVGSDSVATAAYHVAHQMLKERSREVEEVCDE
jgi:hypothetical protein